MIGLGSLVGTLRGRLPLSWSWPPPSRRRSRPRDDLPLQRLRPRTVTPPPSRSCVHYRLCGHFSPSQHQGSHQTRRNEPILEGGTRRRETLMAWPDKVGI